MWGVVQMAGWTNRLGSGQIFQYRVDCGMVIAPHVNNNYDAICPTKVNACFTLYTLTSTHTHAHAHTLYHKGLG